MGDNIENLVSTYIQQMTEKTRSKAPKSVTFSIRLNEWEHSKLLWLADKLGTQKTPLAEQLLKAALDEAIDQYASWASPDDPEKFLEVLEDAFTSSEDTEKEPRAHEGPPPPPPHHHHHHPPSPPPHHGPPPPHHHHPGPPP